MLPRRTNAKSCPTRTQSRRKDIVCTPLSVPAQNYNEWALEGLVARARFLWAQQLTVRTFFSLPAHSRQYRFYVGQSNASYQASGNRCEACADARHVQILTQTSNVWPKTEPRLKDWCHVRLCALFAEVSFIACDCLVTSVPLLCAPHLHTLIPVSSSSPTENLINDDTGWNTTVHKMRPLVGALSGSLADTIHDTVPETSGGRPLHDNAGYEPTSGVDASTEHTPIHFSVQ